MVRHGESSFNVEGRVQGHIDTSSLTNKGIADAKRVGEALSGLTFDVMYTSPLQRARQTGQIIWDQLEAPKPAEPQVIENLIEIGLPLWEGMLFSDVQVKYPELYQHWHQAPHDLKMARSEDQGTQEIYPVRELYQQAQQVWDELLPTHLGQTILLVGHSGINRALLSTALGLTPDKYQMLQQANCCISILNFPDGTFSEAQLEALNLTSHLGLPLPKPRAGYEALRLLLVRHGETHWNREGRFQGQRDIALNENGKMQGQQAADFLQDVQIDFALSSPMLRPRETAELILEQHPQVSLDVEPAFCEISHGTWEGRLVSEIEADYPGELERWRSHPETVQMPEGENLQQVWDRSNIAWNAVVKKAIAQRDPENPSMPVGLVVAHDAVNKVILCNVVGSTADKIWNFKQGNGAVSVIDYAEDGRPTLQAMNITTHLAGGILDQTAAGAL